MKIIAAIIGMGIGQKHLDAIDNYKKSFVKIICEKNEKKIKFLNFRVFKISSILKELSKFIKNNKINIIYAIGMYPSVIASILKFRHSYKLIITRRGVINLTERLKYFYLFLFIYFCSDKIETNSENIFKKFKKNSSDFFIL